ncbi:MAG: DUF6089 family protein [Bacteroidales bacterium]|nr:DUF6089 family protein [Bacteroidales bacterium]
MKKIKVVLIILLFSGILKAQNASEIGGFFGQSFYLGDLNKEKLFKNPALSMGAFYRYILNPRYAIRTSLTYGSLKGNNDNMYNDAPQSVWPFAFKTVLVDLTVQFEFNFRRFEYSARNLTYSPYISGGLGMGYYNKAVTYNYDRILNPGGPDDPDPSNSFNMVIPFGLGVKVNFSRRLSGAILWEFRKTFMDDLDGYEDIPDPGFSSNLHNNDWYYFVGITLSYKINYMKTLCPAYED